MNGIRVFMACALTAATFGAHAYTLADPYGAAFNSNDCSTDHCGGDPYDTAGIDVSMEILPAARVAAA